MPRKILLTAALVISTAVFGQGQSNNPAPVNGPFGGPILVTPSASFPNPAPAAGISDAGRAGITIETNSTAPVETVTGSAGATTAGSEANSALTTESVNTAANAVTPSTSVSGVSATATPG